MTTTLRSLTNLLVVAAMAVSTTAAAQKSSQSAKPEQPYPDFEKVDKNDDRKVTWKEAEAAGIPKEEFESADFDNDGELTRIGYRYTLNHSG